MKWYYVFVKSLREQVRDYWILLLTLFFAPLFVLVYFLMTNNEIPVYDVVFLNNAGMVNYQGKDLDLGKVLIQNLEEYTKEEQSILLSYAEVETREEGIGFLQSGDADVMIVIPEGLTRQITEISPEYSTGNESAGKTTGPPVFELVGDITDIKYIVGAVWTEEMINHFILEATGISMPHTWKETTLGHSGNRTEFELYVPGLMIFAIIMMMFTASASIVREPEAGTLERLKISRLSSFQFLFGTSLIQVIIGIISMLLTMAAAMLLGYQVLPGTFGFILLISFLTSLSIISFSLIVAAMCRSVKDVAIIGTFPLFLLMFFSGAFFPFGGGEIFTLGNHTYSINELLSPTWAVNALNKVLIKGLEPADTTGDMIALLVLTLIYFFLGIRVFRRRHMRRT